MKLYDTGVYFQNGQEIIPENQADLPVAKEEALRIPSHILFSRLIINPITWRNFRSNSIN